ncbi:MAG: dehydrogenase [Mesorhizobium sp. SCN 65-20]|nr:MAG: dehydrogenase [Mesorhizobium sp. SCN 65-20]
MKYLCLVYLEEGLFGTLSAEQKEKLDADSLAYDRLLEAKGKLIAAEALQSVTSARTVKRRDGRRLVTDGPFAETKEQLIGFILIDAGDMEEALDLASHIPLAAMGQVEVRPIYDIPGA